MKIDRDRILYKLEEKKYVDILHRQIKEGLVGTLRNEYLLQKPVREPYKQWSEQAKIFLSLPIFHALVDMLTANLLYNTERKFIDLICDVLDEEIQEPKHE